MEMVEMEVALPVELHRKLEIVAMQAGISVEHLCSLWLVDMYAQKLEANRRRTSEQD
jgi:hypothetical protein